MGALPLSGRLALAAGDAALRERRAPSAFCARFGGGVGGRGFSLLRGERGAGEGCGEATRDDGFGLGDRGGGFGGGGGGCSGGGGGAAADGVSHLVTVLAAAVSSRATLPVLVVSARGGGTGEWSAIEPHWLSRRAATEPRWLGLNRAGSARRSTHAQLRVLRVAAGHALAPCALC